MFLDPFDPGTGREVEYLHELIAVQRTHELLELGFVLQPVKATS